MSVRLSLALGVLVLGLHLALGYSHNFLLGADDDRLWLYTTGAEIGRPEVATELNDRVFSSMARAQTPPHRAFRFGLRAGYRGNYAAAAVVYHQAAAAVQRRLGAGWASDYPAYLAQAMYSGFVAMYVAAAAVLVLIAVLVGDRRWFMAVVVAIAATALLETMFDLAGDTWSGLPTLLPDAQTDETFWQNFWPNFPGLLLNPQVQLSPFGDTPRNHFILLMLPLFLLRWRGWLTASYVFLGLLGFLHQSHTGLVLAYLVALDAVLRPSLFRGPVAIVVLATLAMFVGRESLGAVVGVARPAVLLMVAAVVLGVLACVYYGLRRQAPPVAARLATFRQRLLERGVVFADLAMLGLILLVSFPVVVVINALGSEAQSQYFWTQVHGRSLGILRPGLMLGLAAFALSRGEARLGEARTFALAAACAALALIPSAFEAVRHDRHPVTRLERQIRALDVSIGPAIDWSAIGPRTEPDIYYAIARTIDTMR